MISGARYVDKPISSLQNAVTLVFGISTYRCPTCIHHGFLFLFLVEELVAKREHILCTCIQKCGGRGGEAERSQYR